MQLKKIVLSVITLTGLTSTAHAGLQGPNIGYGQTGGEHSVFSTLTNPVNNQSALNGSAVGIGVAATVSAEATGVENIFDEFQTQIQDKFDLGGGVLTQQDADAFVNAYKDGSLSVSADVVVPILVKTTNYGNISIDLAKSAGVGAKTFKHNQENGVIGVLDVQLGVQAAYVEKTEIGIGFARESSIDMTETFGDGAKLSYGVKGRIVQTGGNLYAYNFNRNLDGTNDTEQEIEDAVEDLNNSVKTDSAFTADFGMRVSTANWNFGATAKNLIPIESDYEVKHDAQATADMGDSYDTKIKIEPFAVVDGSFYTEDRNWKISAYAETNAHQNYLGLDEQNLGVHGSYATDTAWIPDVRIGVDRNFAGSELTKYSAGLTVGILSLDVSASSFDFDNDNQKDFAGAVALSLEAEF